MPQQESIPLTQSPFVPEPYVSAQPVSTATQELSTKLPLAAPNPPLPSRSDLGRIPLTNSPNGRLQHSLPSRPEPPPPRTVEHRVLERPSDRGPRDHARDPRFSERGRAERPGDSLRDRMPDHSMPGSYNRGFEHGSDRPHMPDRNRGDPGWGDEMPLPNRPGLEDRLVGPRRDSRPPSRDGRMERPRERSSNEQQHHLRAEFSGQSMRESPMAPPRSNIIQHPERAALIQAQDQHQSLNSHHPDRRTESSRYEGFSNPERNSRGPSPSRNGDRRPPRRDDRLPIDGRRLNDNEPHSHSSRYGESHLPTGPRTDRPVGHGPAGSNDRFREAMKTDSSVIPPIDPNAGRLSQDSTHHGRQQESQYGRLNPAADIPSGPRLPNGNHPPPPIRAGRTVSAPQSQINTQQPQNVSQNRYPASPVVDKQAPTGPSSVRGGTTRNSTSFPRPESPSIATSAPVTGAQDTADVHPDRLKVIQEGSPAGIAPPLQVNTARVNSQPLSAVSLPTPVGPRVPNTQLASPVGPSPTSRGPPTGPSFGNERNRGDKRFAGIQTMLQQSISPNGVDRSGQGASIRGRGGRANHVNVPSPSASGPPTPSIGRPEPYPPRGDLFAGRSSGPSTPPHMEEDLAYGRRRGGREMPREGERRSERHRNGRSRSRENAPGPPMPPPREDERLPRREELRERPRGNGPPLPMERDMRRLNGPDDQGRGRRPEPDRREMDEWNHGRRGADLERRDERERRDRGGGSGRKRGRPGDEGLGERGHQDNPKRSRRMN